MKKVFLGGTCNGSTWRDKVIEKLKIDYFNPVVKNWTEEDYRRELSERENCDLCLYVITPKMTGAYAIAELVDDSNKRPEKTVFCWLKTDDDKEFNDVQCKSLEKVGVLIEKNGGKYIKGIDNVIEYLNNN